ncbi:MAG: class I SAM-dependent methyltransferase [bacterium]|nr:class I SAM-dependent methyltransferase [bacterium]
MSKNFNTIQYWNKIYRKESTAGEIVKDTYHRNYKNVFDEILKMIPNGSNVLDVACGPGIFCRALKIRKPQTRIMGIDFSGFIINQNKKRDRGLGIKYLQGDIRKELPIGGKFDVIVMSEILEHLKYPEKIVFNIMKSLKRGGLFFISCPHDKDVVHWMKKHKTLGEHIRIWTHDDIFHLLVKHSDKVIFIQPKRLRPDWYEWHILAYIKKS